MHPSIVPVVGVLGIFAVLALSFFLDRWRRTAPENRLAPSGNATPAADPFKARVCRIAGCRSEAVCYEPSIVEHSALSELVSRVLPIGLVPTRLRRVILYSPHPVICETHGAIAERAIDQFLGDENAAIARRFTERAKKTHAFLTVELPKILRGEG